MQNLKSAEEMEEEEREAQSAKLQELIRRGAPEDLQEANRLMKIMAGYDTRSKVDYRAKAAEDVSKIQAKAKLLEERLEGFKAGDSMTDGDVFEELASALQSAQPKIQKMCEEESDDHEAVARLFEINDSIHRTVERYKLMKKGDIEGASKIARGEHVASQAAVKSAAQELNLIDFDGEAEANGPSGNGSAAPTAAGQSQPGGLEDDLLGLSIGDAGGSGGTFGQTGGISLGFGNNESKSQWSSATHIYLHTRAGLSLTKDKQGVPGPSLLSSVTQASTAQGPGPSTSTPDPFSSFNAFNSAPSTSKNNTPQPPNYQQSAFAAPAQAADPFAALSSSNFATGFPNASKSATPAPAPAAAPVSGAPPAPAAPASQANDDDEWNFASALPADTPALPREHRAVVNNTSLKIDMLANRTTGSSNSINLLFAFSNNTAQPISELHFQLAVTKVSPTWPSAW